MDSLPKRKQNRLTGYDYSQPGCYFVTICSRDREHLFGCVVGADVLIGPHVQLSEIGAIVEQTISQIPSVDKYIVMPNHVHILLRLPVANNGPMGTSAPTQSVPWIVRYLKRTVTMACGKTVWQRGYHDHIIRSEADYLRIWDYIDTNPAKWREDCYYCQAEGGDLIVKHTYLFRPGRWRAEGTYYDEADRALPLTGGSEVLRTQQQWTLDGALEVQLPTPLRFTNRYQLRETNFPQTLAWESYNPALGTLTGTFEVVGPNLLSQYRSSDGVYSGFEILTLQADGSYQSTGLSLKSGRRMSAWTALLRAE